MNTNGTIRAMCAALACVALAFGVDAKAQDREYAGVDGLAVEEDPSVHAGDDGVGILQATGWINGSSASETIVWGEIVKVFFCWAPPWNCFNSGYFPTASYVGRGACIFEKDPTGANNWRGAYLGYVLWPAGTTSPFGIRGDDPGVGTYGADVIYPADRFGESEIACGSDGSIRMNWWRSNRFGECCQYVDTLIVDFPADASMEIHGDVGSASTGSDDRIYGWNNYDMLYGNGGFDRVYGGGGFDDVLGQDGRDYLWAEGCSSGEEWLLGGAGIDYMWGSDTTACFDRMWGEGDGDSIFGQRGNDYLSGGSGNDELDGGGGNDNLYGWTGNDKLLGGDGIDYLYGQADIDTLEGGPGNDLIYGGAGDDTLYGSDRFNPSESFTDTCDGGTEYDKCAASPNCDIRTDCEAFP